MFQSNEISESRSVCNIVTKRGFSGREVLLFASSFTYHPGEMGRLFTSTLHELECLKPSFDHRHRFCSRSELHFAPEFPGAFSAGHKPSLKTLFEVGEESKLCVKTHSGRFSHFLLLLNKYGFVSNFL